VALAFGTMAAGSCQLDAVRDMTFSQTG
jgi:hypothetical protein